MSVTKEEIDKYLKKVKIGDRGYFNKEMVKNIVLLKNGKIQLENIKILYI